MENAILHDIKAEQALLGALIFDNSLLDEVPDTFSPNYFSAPLHQKIYETITRIRDTGSVADPITIASQLASDGDLKDAGGRKEF